MFGTLLSCGLNALLYFLFYSALLQKKVDYKNDLWKLTFFVVSISIYMTFSQTHIVEPIRSTLMLIIGLLLFTVLMENKKIANFAVILTSYIITVSILYLSLIIVNIITYFIMPFINEQGRTLLGYFVYFLSCLSLYRKIKTKNVMPFFKEIEIQALACVLSIIFLAIQFYMKLKENSEFIGPDIIVLTMVFVCVIIASLIMGIFLVKKYQEKAKMQAENNTLQAENVNLEKVIEEMFSEIHTQKKVIPTLLETYNEALGSMPAKEIKKTMKEHGNKLLELNRIYLGEEKSKIKQRQQKMILPTTSWTVLNNYFKECNEKAIKNAVNLKFHILADVSVLDQEEIPQLDVIKVFADHIDNSFKEIAKSKNKQGIIEVYFKQSGGTYEIKIEDNAHQFDVDILANLGKRGVSTNGTGNGFANTLNTLTLFDASLIIREYAPEDECYCNKCIIIRFDGLRQFKIQSYRADEIKASAEGCMAIIEYAAKETDTIKQKNEHFNKVIYMLTESSKGENMEKPLDIPYIL